jgi:hypothetical protein
MKPAFASLKVNPFVDDVVREPREVSFSVRGLNDAPLNALLSQFEALHTGDLPRSRPAQATKAQLVVSPDRGYGKSHLLGRLFAKLGRRATKVYLRPFQNPFKAWHSILLLTIQELDRPDDETDGAPSQLEALAIGTLAHVVADFAEDGIPGRTDIPQAVALLRKLGNHSGVLDAEARKLITWLGELVADSGEIRRLCGRLKKRHVDLRGREKAWLKVFAACALDRPDGERWSAALKWMRAEPLDDEEVKLLRLDAADDEGKGDSPAQEINDLAFQRLRGLCQLASYYRPFVFCFDQTEFYASDHALIRTLGNCIDQLFVELPNQLTVITANQENWLTEIEPQFAQPHRDRIEHDLRMEGIKIDGARELIVARLKEYECSESEISAFLADNWLESLFSQVPELGVRAVLMRAADHFRTLARPPYTPSPPDPSIDELFQIEVNGIRAKKALLAYNQDCLMWFAKDIGHGLAGASIQRTDQRRYFSLEWGWPDRQVCFAFEGGDHWKRWQSIGNEALAMARGRGARTLLCYVFRTPDLPRVPRATWTVAKATLDEAKANGFHIVDLSLDQVCELHAARELYSNALQGNIAYSGPETLAWLQTRFATFLNEIAYRPPASGDKKRDGGRTVAPKPANMPPEPAKPAKEAPRKETPARSTALDDKALQIVLDLVRAQRIVDISVVLGRLGSADLRDPLLRSVEAHPNLKAHPGPKTTFLQWRITA